MSDWQLPARQRKRAERALKRKNNQIDENQLQTAIRPVGEDDPPAVHADRVWELGRRLNDVTNEIIDMQTEISKIPPSRKQLRQDGFSCHINTLLEIIRSIMANGQGSIFKNTTHGAILELIHERLIQGVSPNHLSMSFRKFFCGQEENDAGAIMRGDGRYGLFGSLAPQLLRLVFNMDGADFTNQKRLQFVTKNSMYPDVTNNYRASFCIEDATSAANAIHSALELDFGFKVVEAPALFILEPRVISDGPNASQFGKLTDDFEIEDKITIASSVYHPIAISFGNGSHFLAYVMRETENGSLAWFLADDMNDLKETHQPTSADISAMKLKGFYPVQLIYAQDGGSAQATLTVLVVPLAVCVLLNKRWHLHLIIRPSTQFPPRRHRHLRAQPKGKSRFKHFASYESA